MVQSTFDYNQERVFSSWYCTIDFVSAIRNRVDRRRLRFFLPSVFEVGTTGTLTVLPEKFKRVSDGLNCWQ